ncbi:MAG TPA: NAD(P)-dependent oxidoreductase [Brevundimonas sp.]|jgi:UDP-glucose 4-epimerase|uniref:NAD-dependent epimerase/dehydratase family protein n=1 Tax=Brevundimonas sp. TaxID=1871086 RepID=UPI002DF1F8CF|nr:NAD(P)-dependent oxidoreductase [Brevundimonas sp.]
MTAPSSTIALTGGTGLVGKAFARLALARGHRVRLMTRKPLELDDARLEQAEFDLAGTSVSADALAGCTSVVHLAAHIPANMADPTEAQVCFDRNAMATLRLLDAAEAAGVGRFVHTSSANAYAAGQAHPDEGAPQYPVHRGTYYLTSKMAQELFAAHRATAGTTEVVCLRLSSVYGPGQQKGALVGMTRSLLGGQAVTLANGGRFAADFVHVDDVASALIAALGPGASGSYNVGSGVRSSMAEIADVLARCTGAAPSLIVRQDVVAEDPGFPALDIGRARRELGYDPVGVDEGLKSLVDFLRDPQPTT